MIVFTTFRSSCGGCDTRVVKCRLGDDLNRITFFCPRCQDLKFCNEPLKERGQVATDPSYDQRKKDLASEEDGLSKSRQALKSWLTRPAEAATSQGTASTSSIGSHEWSCHACTLHNSPSWAACAVCGTEKKEELIETLVAGWNCDACTFLNDPDDQHCSMCATERIVPVVNRKRRASASPTISASSSPTVTSPSSTVHYKGFKFRRTSFGGDGKDGGSGGRISWGGEDMVARDRVARPDDVKMISGVNENHAPFGRMNSGGDLTNSRSGQSPVAAVEDDASSRKGGAVSAKEKISTSFSHLIPRCRHSRHCDVRMVRKSEENRGRLYFACSAFKADKCDFFQVGRKGEAGG